jgi:hypothetical protein
VMRTFIAVIGLSALFAITAVAGEMTGYISDRQCAAASAKAATAAEWINPNEFEGCAKKCVKAGSPVVFVTVDNKILQIDADSMKTVMPQLGHKVTVNGRVENGILKIDSIQSIKM